MSKDTPNNSMRPIAAVGIVVIDKGRLLLIKRRQPPHTDCWTIPGGKIRFGESMLAAAEREICEETGLIVEALRPIHVVELIGTAEGGARYHYVVVDIATRLRGGIARAADDAAEVGWFGVDHVRDASVEKNSRELMARIFAGEFADLYRRPAIDSPS